MFEYDDEAYWVVAYPDVSCDSGLESLVWANEELAKKCPEASRNSFPTDVLEAADRATNYSGLSCPTEPGLLPPTYDGERRRMLYYLWFLHDLREANSEA